MISCKFEDGIETNLRHAVVDVLVIENNKILLIKRSGTSYKFPNRIALPGGYVDMNETIEEAALREVLEETGYKTKVEKLLKFKDDPKREERQNITFIYIMSPIEKVKEPDAEVSEILWVDLDKLPAKGEFAFDHFEIISDYLKSPS